MGTEPLYDAVEIGVRLARKMAPDACPEAIGTHLGGRDYLPFLSFLSFFLPAMLSP